MIGTDANTGQPLGGIAHLQQSIQVLLSTPLGSRVMRRDYGSHLYQLIDSPLNSSTILNFYAATAKAIAKWEPRFKLTNTQIVSSTIGQVIINLTGTYLPTGKAITLSGITVT